MDGLLNLHDTMLAFPIGSAVHQRYGDMHGHVHGWAIDDFCTGIWVEVKYIGQQGLFRERPDRLDAL